MSAPCQALFSKFGLRRCNSIFLNTFLVVLSRFAPPHFSFIFWIVVPQFKVSPNCDDSVAVLGIGKIVGPCILEPPCDRCNWTPGILVELRCRNPKK